MAAYRDFSSRGGKKLSNRRPALPEKAKKIIQKNKGVDMLFGMDAFALMKEIGISAPKCEEADTPKQAVAAARRIGYPVAMKISSAALSHKTDVGGVALNISSDRAAALTAGELFSVMKKHKAEGRILIQKMSEPGIELIVGARRDPSFGPVVVFGMGGVLVEVLRDTALRLTPVNQAEAMRMIDSIAGSALLRGVRGAKPVDRASVARAIVSVSRLIAAEQRIAELDINPLIATYAGCVAVDVRIGFLSAD
jgi:acyl-CoA synthetase (NDP forming)